MEQNQKNFYTPSKFGDAFSVKLSVVIPTHNRVDGVLALLNTLRQQDIDMSRLEVLVVSNLPDRQLSQSIYSTQWPFVVHVLEVGQIGVNSARNRGLRAAKSEFVYFLDDDCLLVEPTHLKRLWAFHHYYPQAAAIGGDYLLPQSSSRVEKAYHDLGQKWMESQIIPGSTNANNLLGGNVSYKKSLLLKNRQFFDETIVFGGAEAEFHSRLLTKGLEMRWVPLPVVHNAKVTMAQFYKKAFLQGIGSVKFRSHMTANRQGANRNWSSFFFRYHYQKQFHRGRKEAREAGLNAKIDLPTFSKWQFSIASFEAVFVNPVKLLYWDIYLGPEKGIKARVQKCLDRSERWESRLQEKVSLLVLGLNPLRQVKPFELADGPSRYLPISSECRAKCFDCHLLGARRLNELSARPTPSALCNIGFQGITFPCNFFELSEAQKGQWFELYKGMSVEVLLRPRYFHQYSGEEILSAVQWLQGKGVQVLLLFEPTDKLRQMLQILRIAKTSWRIVFVFGVSGGVNALADYLAEEDWKRLQFLSASQQEPVVNDRRNKAKALEVSEIHRLQKKLNVQHAVKTSHMHFSFYGAEVGGAVPSESAKSVFCSSPMELSQRLSYSFVIPVKDQLNHVIKILKNLQLQKYAKDQFEVILVDDGNHTNLLARVQAEGHIFVGALQVRVVEYPRQSAQGTDQRYRAGQARNAGLQFARGKSIVFIDSDILVAPDLLSKLDGSLKENMIVQMPRLMLTEEASQGFRSYESVEFATDIYRQSQYWEQFNKVSEWMSLKNYWKYTCTYGLAITRKTLQDIGPFREDFRYYGFEDVDLGFRVFQRKGQFHLLTSPVFHLHPESDNNYHFDFRKRYLALAKSASLFFQINLDLNFYFDLNFFLHRPWYIRLRKPYYFGKYVLAHRILPLYKKVFNRTALQ